jgi:hypothetical protein
MMPKIAEGDANKVWIVPSEIGRALEGLGSTMNSLKGIPDEVDGPLKRVDMGPSEPEATRAGSDPALSQANRAVEEAIAAAESAQRLQRPSSAPAADAPGPADPTDPSPEAPGQQG